jgi:hypothetical protein
MIREVIPTAITAWAAMGLPGRLYAAQVAKLLNCTLEDVTVLSSSGKLRALGNPRPNGVKLFSTIELITLLADRDWLDDVTKTISQHWRRKNERRNRRASKGNAKLMSPAVAHRSMVGDAAESAEPH